MLVQANHFCRVHAEVSVVEEERKRARQLRLLVDHLGGAKDEIMPEKKTFHHYLWLSALSLWFFVI